MEGVLPIFTIKPDTPNMQCPLCSYEKADGSSECPGCGIVFAKWHQRQTPPPPGRSAAAATIEDEETEAGRIRFDHAIARLSHWVGSLLITMTVAWDAFLIVRQYGILHRDEK